MVSRKWNRILFLKLLPGKPRFFFHFCIEDIMLHAISKDNWSYFPVLFQVFENQQKYSKKSVNTICFLKIRKTTLHTCEKKHTNLSMQCYFSPCILNCDYKLVTDHSYIFLTRLSFIWSIGSKHSWKITLILE